METDIANQTFEFYTTAWLIYCGLGTLVLLMIGYAMREASWHAKLIVLSLIGVGAFTPDTVVNAETYAPLVITALLKAEVEGSGAIISGLIRLLVIWGVIIFASLAARHFWLAKINTPTNKASGVETE